MSYLSPEKVSTGLLRKHSNAAQDVCLDDRQGGFSLWVHTAVRETHPQFETTRARRFQRWSRTASEIGGLSARRTRYVFDGIDLQ